MPAHDGPRGPSDGPQRWVLKKKRWVTLFGVAVTVVASTGALWLVRSIGIVVYVLWAAIVGGFALKVLIESADEELALDGERLQWGPVGKRAQGAFALAHMAQVDFYRRADGTGAIEVQFTSGKKAFVPAHFTDLVDVSDQLVAALRAKRPELVVRVH